MTTTVDRGGGSLTRFIMYAAIAALVFQAVHFVEHVAQLGYWFAHPADAPWLTPWAVQGRDILAVGGEPALGNELLHLLGNLIFLGGLVGLVAVCSRRQRTGKEYPALRTAVVIQGFHVVEHVALTATSLIYGKAIGLSTFLGLVAGPVMTSFRVWFHLLINLVATWYAGRALAELNAGGILIPTTPSAPRATAMEVEPAPARLADPLASGSGGPSVGP